MKENDCYQFNLFSEEIRSSGLIKLRADAVKSTRRINSNKIKKREKEVAKISIKEILTKKKIILIVSSSGQSLMEEACPLCGLLSEKPGNASRKKDFRFPTKEQTGFQIEKG